MSYRTVSCAVLGAIICVALFGCGGSTVARWFGFSHAPTPPATVTDAPARPAITAPAGTPEHAIEVLNRRLDELDGERASLEKERDRLKHEALVGPLRATLHWIEGLALLGLVAGIALAVVALCTPVSFAAKVPLWIALACAAVLGVCLCSDWVLDHLWIVGSTAVLALILGALWFFRHYLHFCAASRVAWLHVPDHAPTGDSVDRLLDRLLPTKLNPEGDRA